MDGLLRRRYAAYAVDRPLGPRELSPGELFATPAFVWIKGIMIIGRIYLESTGYEMIRYD